MVALRLIESARSSLDLADDTADLLVVIETRAWLALGDLEHARRSVGKLAGVGGAVGREVASVALSIAVASHDPHTVFATATRLSKASTAGMFDPLGAARALASAATLAPDAPTSARWHARAVGLASAAIHQAEPEDKPAIQRTLDNIVGLSAHADTPPSATVGQAIKP